jgi:hypothetical protein
LLARSCRKASATATVVVAVVVAGPVEKTEGVIVEEAEEHVAVAIVLVRELRIVVRRYPAELQILLEEELGEEGVAQTSRDRLGRRRR